MTLFSTPLITFDEVEPNFTTDLGLYRLTPLSTVFQLYRGGQFY